MSMKELFRKIENVLERHVEGENRPDMFALEASRMAQRLLLNHKFKLNKLTIIPNLIIVPFTDSAKVKKGYAAELVSSVSRSIDTSSYTLLSPLMARFVSVKDGFKCLEVAWSDEAGQPLVGLAECVEGPMKGKLWGIPPSGAVIGRGIDATICVRCDLKMSRMHLKVSVTAKDRIALRDLNSSNGTFVKGAPLAVQKGKKIESGTEVYLGVSSFCFYALPGQYERWGAPTPL
ncbi:MAG: FHA domain-containing protein [Candidatus Bruticola sp.]